MGGLPALRDARRPLVSLLRAVAAPPPVRMLTWSAASSVPVPNEHQRRPDYANWSLKDLRAEAEYLSLRKASTKPTLVKQLEAVWNARHLGISDDDDESVEVVAVSTSRARPAARRRGKQGIATALDAAREPVTLLSSDSEASASGKKALRRTPKTANAAAANADTGRSPKRKARSKSKSPSDDESLPRVLSDSDSSASAYKKTTPKRSKARSKSPKGKGKASGSESDSGAEQGSEEEIVEEAEPAAQPDLAPQTSLLLKRAIRSDGQLWKRILLMEPIPLDEFISVANRPLPATAAAAKRPHGAGLSIKTGKQRPGLRSWLELQGICTFTDEPTGSRGRR